MSRLLLLMTTASYKANAFMTAAARLGSDLVLGMEQTPSLAHLNPRGHLTLDFSNPEDAVGRIVEHARLAPIDAVLASDDEGATLAALAAEALGLRHNPVAAVRATRSKLATRQALHRAGLLTPWFESYSLGEDPTALAGRIRYPCVLKPLHLAASRGVMRCNDAGELALAWRRLRAIMQRPDRETEILLEGFIPGFEVALEGLVTRGRLQLLALFDKPDPLDGPFFEETIYTTPSRHPAAVQRQIIRTTEHALTALGVTHGPIHAELRYNEQGAWLLEAATRSIGGLCSRSLRIKSPGEAELLSLEELILRHASGSDVSQLGREASASGVMMIPIPRAGILRRVDGVGEASRVAGIKDVKITLATGREVSPPPEGSRYLGFLFARAEDPAKVESALRAAHQRLRVDIEPAGDPSGMIATTRDTGACR